MNEYYVYVAEAYKDGDRIERIVHKNESDAEQDIKMSTSTDDPDRFEVDRERLYLGDDTEWNIEL